MEFSALRFVELGFSSSWRGVCRWILLPRRRVVGLSMQSGWCSSPVAGSRKDGLSLWSMVVATRFTRFGILYRLIPG
ncbi:unnamed protein product [Eruca vesicaria subsp. sativa]|uniref:Uncharacterized protein n=1 Tax=Eruca vesicaria subsp. sativa TaxID=29727 RepID=A0ABC8LII1_ERUVS|nr:unnamed protein product [Eruca vesicaria subsp. sativa]